MPQSDTAANSKCAGLARACSAAADEITAGRKYIEGLKQIIVAHDARLEVAKREIETLKQIGSLESERATKLEEVIKAEREAKAALLEQINLQEKRIDSLEKKLSRSRKLTWIVAGVVGAGVLVLARK